MTTNKETHASISNRGGIVAFGAFFLWGLLPLYWKLLAEVNSVEVLCNRMVWSFATMLPILLALGRMGEVFSIFKDKKNLLTLTCSSLILATNWGIYIWAVNSGHVLEASLGYFITPLLNMMLGIIFFKERPTTTGWISLVLAVVGVAYQLFTLRYFPWIAFVIGGTFSVYSFLRKVVKVEALPGLFVETIIFFPLAAAALIIQAARGFTAFSKVDVITDLLLIASGLVTTLPLVAFAYGARRITMTTLGLLQYVTPSLAFLLGIFVFHEPLNVNGLITFILIWTALALYTWDNIHRRLKGKG